MKRKTVLVIMALLALGAVAVSAQTRVSLNIVCNQAGAQVYINGRIAGNTSPNFSILLSKGTYDVSVQKTGFQPFVTKVTIGTMPVTLNVVLVPTGQSTTPVTTNNVTITANVPGADVYINNVYAGETPFTALLATGSYTVAVKAPGYNDYVQNVRVSGALTINAVLQASQTLSVNSNVQGADVYLDNMMVGKTPYVAPISMGNHLVVVKAAGYNDYSQNIMVSGSVTVNAIMQAALVPFSLGNLLPGAEVFLNGISYGKSQGGQFTIQVQPGTYALTIRLAGFIDLNMQVTIGGGGYSLTPNLQPQMATYSFELPDELVNPAVKRNPWGQIKLYIDNVAQKNFQGQIAPGKHIIRLVSGAFQIQMEFVFEGGKNYVLMPFFGIKEAD
ncbi:MAG: PEGA domain-containing protein [Spirochaetales bacterium]|nr:PEGA domain-containing protein [Spirochaetales bacterium]